MTEVVRPTKIRIQINGAGIIGLPHEKKESPLIQYMKINSKRIIGLNIKLKIRKLLEESTGKILCDLGLDKDFLARTQKGMNHKRK